MNEIVRSTYKKSILKIQNVWFANEGDIPEILNQSKKMGVDVLNIHGVRFSRKPEKWNEQYTIVSDLNETEEEILSKIRKNYRYEIRRTEKEGVVIRQYDGREFADKKVLLDTFEETYNQMYRDKGMKTVFNRAQVEEYLRTNCMLVTIGFFDETPYVFHSYIYNKNNARFYYSTSSFRSDKDIAALIGRINKATHWHDMKMFKKMGVTNYDWGGVSDKNASNGIDKFKIGFGGHIDKYYNKFIGVSLKGKMAIKLRKMMKY